MNDDDDENNNITNRNVNKLKLEKLRQGFKLADNLRKTIRRIE